MYVLKCIKILLLFFISLTVVSCQKKYCWQCEMKKYDTLLVPRSYGGRITSVSDSLASICDMSKKDIRRFEDDNSWEIYYHSQVTTCTK